MTDDDEWFWWYIAWCHFWQGWGAFPGYIIPKALTVPWVTMAA